MVKSDKRVQDIVNRWTRFGASRALPSEATNIDISHCTDLADHSEYKCECMEAFARLCCEQNPSTTADCIGA